MEYTELKQSITEGAKSIYLLEGDDAYFRMKGEEQIKSAFLEMPELNFTSFDGETLKGSGISALVSAVKNYPFMAEKRVVKVSEFYPTENEYENYLKNLFENFPPSAILIIVNTGAKKGVDLKRKHAVTFVNCGKADPETVSKWVYITLRRAGVNTSTSCSERIAEYCLYNMARVAVEVQKLIDYKQEGTLTREEVDELVFKDADYRIYELTNAAASRNFTKFCEVADELQKKAGDEVFLLNGLFNYFKNLLTVISSGESNAELSKLLKMKEFAVKKSREQAERIGQTRLEEWVGYIYSAISDMKCGRLTPQSALQTVENAIFFGIG
ncbi:MAG: DNA polymerase III subunit delta [Clostridia bacterium]|nr:DNA polymerase III subunit delta [Clostridia bacterium]